MRTSRSWPILVMGFGALVLLVGLFGFASVNRAKHIYAEMQAAYESHRQAQQALAEMRAGIYLGGLFVRDYLLDASNLRTESYRQQFSEIHESSVRHLNELRKPARPEEAAALDGLRGELEAYFKLLAPVFEWTPQQKVLLSERFLREQVLPRRNAALAMALEVRDLNRAHFAHQQQELERSQASFRRFLNRMTALSLALGLLVAGASVARITQLEKRNLEHQKRVEQAEQELRRLSQQLVQAQETERKLIARELHDQIGQMLTAVRIDLSRLMQTPEGGGEPFRTRLRDARQTAEQALRAVRDLAMGLRPSMLDDLGLAPAIEWQARDYSRRAGVPVHVQVDGNLGGIPEAHRTCIYRAVQEALTNCARHARARNIRILLHGGSDRISLAVQDDGVGFGPGEGRGSGLGLIGMEERVGELGGRLEILSQPHKGTLIRVELPVGGETRT